MSTSGLAVDVCNMSRFETFEYPVKAPVLEKWLHGEGFDNKERYTQTEFDDLCRDINNIYTNITTQNIERGNLALITAGGPGVGKTTKLEQILEERRKEGRVIAYNDPDAVCLKQQENTFLKDVQASDKTVEARKTCYDKWRPGSNAGVHLIISKLVQDCFSFAFGTTSSSPMTAATFKYLKDKGYFIRLVHISSPSDVCFASIQKRDREFIQTTLEDVRDKALMVPQRITDTYLRYADEIEFYYRDKVDEDALLAAKWARIDDRPRGVLSILSPDAYTNIKTIHNTVVSTRGAMELSWENTVEACSVLPKS